MGEETLLSKALDVIAIIGICILFVFGVAILVLYLKEQYLMMNCIQNGGVWFIEHGKGCFR